MSKCDDRSHFLSRIAEVQKAETTGNTQHMMPRACSINAERARSDGLPFQGSFTGKAPSIPDARDSSTSRGPTCERGWATFPVFTGKTRRFKESLDVDTRFCHDRRVCSFTRRPILWPSPWLPGSEPVATAMPKPGLGLGFRVIWLCREVIFVTSCWCPVKLLMFIWSFLGSALLTAGYGSFVCVCVCCVCVCLFVFEVVPASFLSKVWKCRS